MAKKKRPNRQTIVHKTQHRSNTKPNPKLGKFSCATEGQAHPTSHMTPVVLLKLKSNQFLHTKQYVYVNLKSIYFFFSL